MPIPSYDGTMLPLLRLLGDGVEHDVREVRDRLATQFKLTDDERQQRLPSGRVAVFDSRVGWGKTYLEKAGLLATARRGAYRITDAGKAVLAENPPRIDKAYLMRFESFRAFAAPAEGETTLPAEAPPVAAASGITPEES